MRGVTDRVPEAAALPEVRIGSSGAAWTARCPDGTWLGVFEPPDGFDLVAVAGGYALVVVKDEMDVESVAVYELVGW